MDYRAQCKVNPRLKESLRAATQWKKAELRALLKQEDYVFREHKKNIFASEGATVGAKWKALTPEYAKAKKKKWGRRKILAASGALRKSLTQTKKTNKAHVSYYTVKPNPTINMGTRSRVAAYHGGSRFHNKRLPVRDAMAHSEQERRKYLRIAWDYILKMKGPRAQKIMAAWPHAKGGVGGTSA